MAEEREKDGKWLTHLKEEDEGSDLFPIEDELDELDELLSGNRSEQELNEIIRRLLKHGASE